MKLTLIGLAAAAALTLGAHSQAAAATSPKTGVAFRDCPGCPEMVVVPAGKFQMGADGGEPERYEGPVRPVAIARPFAVGVLPVTVGQFRAFIDATGHQAAKNCIAPKDGRYVPVPGSDWKDPALGRPPREDEPVVCIDWRDAKAYVEWLAKRTGQPYRMMSEAEWEYVARGGKATLYPWGDDPEGACKAGNLLDGSASTALLQSGTPTKCADGYQTLAPAGRFPANAFGVKDMVGNAWTWVEDCYVMPYPTGPLDGRPYVGGACERRSVRGSSWGTTVSRARPTFRGRDPVDRVSQLFGLRVARDVK